ncbi:MarR family transcriptional regulator [Saxibacter everestensis]|uniref:MarR family transcriptional regulator n=1 Tax=Saxibacter everestensis TaxID=2909229 RepID=A0ABY8QUW0_9MICO|nr:MarR family transcriptional regulator [Brevibacteriaceae bacterium ZFBP1038]
MDLAYELHDLVRTLDKWAERILRPEGLSYNRYVALVIVSEHPGMTGRELAGALGVTEAASSGIVRSLLDAGLFEDLAPSGTGNVRLLGVTKRGTILLGHCSALLGSSLDDNATAIGIDPHGLARTIHALHDEVRTVRSPSQSAE